MDRILSCIFEFAFVISILTAFANLAAVSRGSRNYLDCSFIHLLAGLSVLIPNFKPKQILLSLLSVPLRRFRPVSSGFLCCSETNYGQ